MHGAFSIKANHCEHSRQVDFLCVMRDCPDSNRSVYLWYCQFDKLCSVGLIRALNSRWVNQWDEEQVRELVMDQQKGTN
jgi:hypothetical protein